jgi:hypothetical protein
VYTELLACGEEASPGLEHVCMSLGPSCKAQVLRFILGTAPAGLVRLVSRCAAAFLGLFSAVCALEIAEVDVVDLAGVLSLPARAWPVDGRSLGLMEDTDACPNAPIGSLGFAETRSLGVHEVAIALSPGLFCAMHKEADAWSLGLARGRSLGVIAAMSLGVRGGVIVGGVLCLFETADFGVLFSALDVDVGVRRVADIGGDVLVKPRITVVAGGVAVVRDMLEFDSPDRGVPRCELDMLVAGVDRVAGVRGVPIFVELGVPLCGLVVVGG